MPEASSVRKVVRFVEVDNAPRARLWTRVRKLKIDKHVCRESSAHRSPHQRQ